MLTNQGAILNKVGQTIDTTLRNNDLGVFSTLMTSRNNAHVPLDRFPTLPWNTSWADV
jgi:hypothetical protein